MRTGTGLRAALARHWLAAAAIMAAFPLALTYFSMRQPAVYEAEAIVLVQQSNAAFVAAGLDASPSAGPSLATEAQIAGLPIITAKAKEGVVAPEGVAASASLSLRIQTTANTASESRLLKVVSRARDRDYASALATAAAREYVAFRGQIETRQLREARAQLRARLEELQQEGGADANLTSSLTARIQSLDTALILAGSPAELLQPASVARQVEPRVARALVQGLLGGLVLAALLAVALDRVETRVRGREEVEGALGIPTLGTVPPAAGRNFGRGWLERPDAMRIEAFRTLRNHLRLALVARGGSKVIVTSARPGEGKSTTLIQLAMAAAKAGQDVLMVDLDLRRPSLARYLGPHVRTDGVTDVLSGDVPLAEAIQDVPLGEGLASKGRLRLLAAGEVLPNAGELVASDGLQRVVEQATEGVDLVLIDSPPLLAVSDASSIAAFCDGTLLVVEARGASRRGLLRLRGILEGSGHRPLGIVVVDRLRSAPEYAYYGNEALRGSKSHGKVTDNRDRGGAESGRLREA